MWPWKSGCRCQKPFRPYVGSKTRLLTFLVAAFWLAALETTASAQVPILYYDFENNASRTVFENLVEQSVNNGSTPVARAGNTTTISAVAGAGVFNGGAATGQAATGSNWDNSAADPGSAATNYYQLVVNTSGFSQISIAFDNQASASGPARLGVLYSTDGSNFTAQATVLTGNAAFTATTFDLSSVSALDNQSLVTIRLYAFAGSAADRTGRSAFASSGTLRIDNLAVRARTIHATKVLLDYAAIGLSIRSGSVFTPAYPDFSVNAPGINVGLASELRISGAFIVSNGTLGCGEHVVSGSGSFTVLAGATLGIGSNVGIASSGPSGNIQTTVRNFDIGANYLYQGSSPQSTGNGLPSTVNDLSIDNSAGVSLTSSVVVSGVLALSVGAFTVGANILTIANPIAGTMANLSADNSSSIAIVGTATGIGLPGSVSSLNNLTVSNPAGLNLLGDLALGGTLGLISGDVTTGSFTLFMANSSTSTGDGDVVGNIHRGDLAGAIARSFGNPNVQITITAGTVTALTVNLIKASPADFRNSARRTYTLKDVVGTLVTATLRLHYLDDELNGNSEPSLELWRRDESAWISQGATLRDSSANWVEQTMVTSFSPWTISGPAGPTYVSLVNFSGVQSTQGPVLLRWETGEEVNNLGFNLYRETGGARTRINQSLILGSGFMAKPGTVMTAGRSYLWRTEPPMNNDSSYWLEEIDLDGTSAWHGPILVNKATDEINLMSGIDKARLTQAVTMKDLGTESARAGATETVSTRLGPLEVTAAKLRLQLDLASQDAVKITVQQEGWYRISKQQLIEAGLNQRTDPRSLQLYTDGVEIPISITPDVDRFDSASAIEFYALELDTPSTDHRVYWLVYGKTPGRRIATIPAGNGSQIASSFRATVERRDRSLYLSGVRNGDRENFFGVPVGSAPVDQTVVLKHVDTTAPAAVSVEVKMQGFSLTPHRVTVALNGTPLGVMQYEGAESATAQFTVSNGPLAEGQNVVTLSGQHAAVDVSAVDYIRLSYWRKYSADDNALKFTAVGGQQVTITGFTRSDVRVLDISSPTEPSLIAATVLEDPSGFSVMFAVPGTAEHTLIAFCGNQIRSTLSLKVNHSSSWRRGSNLADLVIITHENLSDSVAPLAALRQSQGLKVAMVDVEDIYDEFNFGNKSPQAIRDFLSYASAQWKRAPRYVLLAGSASYDPKDYNGLGSFDLVPTKLIDTDLSETASDDWFVDSDMDGIGELAIGRLPVRTAEQARNLVSKLLTYDITAPQNSALLVSDENLGFDFEGASNSLAPLVPTEVNVKQINRRQLGTSAAKQFLLNGIASGQKIVNYVGHGSPGGWKDGLLTTADALSLTNTGRYPLFVLMTCLNGQFHHPQLTPLATGLMNATQAGAIAVWASSGLTSPTSQSGANQRLFSELFQTDRNGHRVRLGDAVVRAKAAANHHDVRRTWILFGDPSMRLK